MTTTMTPVTDQLSNVHGAFYGPQMAEAMGADWQELCRMCNGADTATAWLVYEWQKTRK
jgi:hypothetical protein